MHTIALSIVGYQQVQRCDAAHKIIFKQSKQRYEQTPSGRIQPQFCYLAADPMPTFTAYLAAIMGKLPKTSKTNPVQANGDTVTWYKKTAKAYEISDLTTDLSAPSKSFSDTKKLNAEILAALKGDDVIIGSGFADTLHGYKGSDTIYGGNGKDILYGDEGADVFVLDEPPTANNVDTIQDFNRSEGDKIHLDSSAFAGLSAGILQSDAFVSTRLSKPVLESTDPQVIYNSKTGTLYFDPDGSGTESSLIKVAIIVGKPDLRNTDIEIVTALDLGLF